MATRDIGHDAEAFVRELARDLTAPYARECLVCYLDRMLHEYICDGTLRFVRRFRGASAPRARHLPERMARMGGDCDCAVLRHVYESVSIIEQFDRSRVLDVCDVQLGVHPMPRSRSRCKGTRERYSQPCALWRRPPPMR